MSPPWRLWPLMLALLLVTACTSGTERGGETTSTSTTTPISTTSVVSTTTSTVPIGPLSYLFYGWEGVTRVEGGVATRLTIEPTAWAAEDGAGGIVFRSVTEEPGWVWLPSGAERPVEVDLGDEGWPGVELAGLIEGRPSVVANRSGDGMVWCERQDLVEEVLVLDLETGTERFVMCRYLDPDVGYRFSSHGGGLFTTVTAAATVYVETSVQLSFFDLLGREATVEHNPFAESCAPCELDAHLSPDGRLLACAYWPTAFWDVEMPDGDVEQARDEWWEAGKDIPTELVVVDLETGVERWRTEAPARTRLAEFDGRYLTVSTDTGRAIHDTVGIGVDLVPPAQTEPTDFWVAILDSLDTATHSYEDAQQVAAQIAKQHGVETGVLRSEGWLTLNPGYWAVFTGGYATRVEAASVCEELKPQIEVCYPRYVATAETIDPEIGLGMLELRADGLGVVDFGDPVEEVMSVLTRILGEPDWDSIVNPAAENRWVGYGASEYFRDSGWDDWGLVVFSDADYFRDDGVPHFIAWYGSPGLVTPEGIGIGSTVAELQAAYGDKLELAPEYSDECGQGWSFRIGPLFSRERGEQIFDQLGEWFWYTINGALDGDPANPESRVIGLHAGATEAC